MQKASEAATPAAAGPNGAEGPALGPKQQALRAAHFNLPSSAPICTHAAASPRPQHQGSPANSPMKLVSRGDGHKHHDHHWVVDKSCIYLAVTRHGRPPALGASSRVPSQGSAAVTGGGEG